MTLTGKRPPNRDPELQRTELVQDTQALMVQDTQALMVQDTQKGRFPGSIVKLCISYIGNCSTLSKAENVGELLVLNAGARRGRGVGVDSLFCLYLMQNDIL